MWLFFGVSTIIFTGFNLIYSLAEIGPLRQATQINIL